MLTMSFSSDPVGIQLLSNDVSTFRSSEYEYKSFGVPDFILCFLAISFFQNYPLTDAKSMLQVVAWLWSSRCTDNNRMTFVLQVVHALSKR